MRNRKGLNVITNVDGFNILAQLYATKIYKQTNEVVILNSGGYKTNHTKNCMNDLLPSGFRVFQKDFNWFVDTPKGVLEFSDNMELEIA